MDTITRLIIFFGILLLSFSIRAIFLNILDKKIAKILRGKTELNDKIIHALKNPVGYFILLQGFILAITMLELPKTVGEFDTISVLDNINVVVSSFIVLYFIFSLIDVVSYYFYKNAKKASIDEQVVSLFIKSLRILVIVIGILVIIQYFGYNIVSLLAGLGIGGLALALAAQTTLNNIFGSITILSDRPFHLGDWISIGDVEGTVEDVGFRSTRIRRFDHALVIVPNSQFISKEIINFSAMKKRRIKFELRLVYGTTAKQIKEVVSGIKKFIEEDERFDPNYTVRFTDFAESSLNIFVYCFTKTTDWNEFLKIREEFNLKIMTLLEKLNIKIAEINYKAT